MKKKLRSLSVHRAACALCRMADGSGCDLPVGYRMPGIGDVHSAWSLIVRCILDVIQTITTHRHRSNLH